MSMLPYKVTNRLSALVIGVAALPLLSGCNLSQDQYPYESTTWSPKTVVLTDTRTGEELWRYPVPVGVELTVDFETGEEENLRFPDVMVWEARSTIGTSFRENGEVLSPPEGVRRLDMYLRDKPEYPRPDAPIAQPAPLPDAETPEAEVPQSEPLDPS